MTIEHSMTEHHVLTLASADPFGLTFENRRDPEKPTRMHVNRVEFFVEPANPGARHSGCTVYGNRVLTSGKLGRSMVKYIGTRYGTQWGQVPEDIKAEMARHGFVVDHRPEVTP